MPFTPSHAVIALPFIHTPLVPAAIAVGAMAPDLPLFVRARPLSYARTHDLAWLPATIVVAVALLLVWRCVLRPAVRALSPRWLAVRLPAHWDRGAAASIRETWGIVGSPAKAPWRGILLLLVSVAIGILSHIVWDLFTHEGRWGVQILPALDEKWGPLSGYKWIQHGSSLLGLGILAIWALLWLRRRPVGARSARVLPNAVRWMWWLSLPLILLFSWAIGLAVYGPLTAEWTSPHLAYRVLPPACAVWGVLTIALAVGVQVLRARRTGSRSAASPELSGDRPRD